MTQVARTLTPLTRDETAARFVPAYRAVFGEEPDRNRAELLLALAWLENANGQSFIQFNWGNLSVKPSDADAYWRPPWFDLAEVEALPEGAKKARLLDVHARMVAGKAPEAFRAFGSHEEGLAAWLRLLKARPAILDAASSGDSTRFAHAIFSTRYCPDVECRDAGPSYGKLRDQIRAAGYFAGLKKKIRARAAAPAWCLALASWAQWAACSPGVLAAGLGDA
jgi:hypothetical protein